MKTQAVPKYRYNHITRQAAEIELDNLVQKCIHDVNLGKEILDVHYQPIGKEMIVGDYLLWARKFEPYVEAEYYQSCVERMQKAGRPAPRTKTKRSVSQSPVQEPDRLPAGGSVL